MPKTTTSALENHLYARVRGAIKGLPRESAADVYALSFWVYADEDDPRRQVLDVSFNTSAQATASAKKASTPAEAKWNFAFWLQNQIEVIGGDDDPAAGELREEWLDAEGLNYTDEDEESDFDRTVDLGMKSETKFWHVRPRQPATS